MSRKADKLDLLGPISNPEYNNDLYHTSRKIQGTASDLSQHLKDMTLDIKDDKQNKLECEKWLYTLNEKKARLQRRIDANETWISNFEKDNGEGGSLENQYKALVDKIALIYKGVKDFHGKGIDMLIDRFNYHITYKRWNDTFSATPFAPK